MNAPPLNECFFVSRLPGDTIEIQILDKHGEGIDSVEGPIGTSLRCGAIIIPEAVLRAAARQREGKGDYVTAEGVSVDPFTMTLRLPAAA